MDGQMDGWSDGWMDGVMDGAMDGWMDGWMARASSSQSLYTVPSSSSFLPSFLFASLLPSLLAGSADKETRRQGQQGEVRR